MLPKKFSVQTPVTKVDFSQKTQSVIVPPQGEFVSAGLCRHITEWERVTKDTISLQAIRGTKKTTEVYTSSPLHDSSRAGHEEGDPGPAAAQGHTVVPRDTEVFLSSVFTVPKLERG